MGVLHSNALAFLPALTEGQISALQTDMNAGIRAVLNLPRKSIISMTALRVKHGFLSVTDVRDKCLMLAAQKNREIYMKRTQNLDGPNTRAKSRNTLFQEMDTKLKKMKTFPPCILHESPINALSFLNTKLLSVCEFPLSVGLIL